MDVDDDHDTASQPAAAPAAGRHDELIERWFAKAFHGSPHMRDSAAFNHVRAEVNALKQLLATAE